MTNILSCLRSPPRMGFSESGFGNVTLAREVMTSNMVAVGFEYDLAIACKAMIGNRINGVGVLINGELGGLVSNPDVTRSIVSWSLLAVSKLHFISFVNCKRCYKRPNDHKGEFCSVECVQKYLTFQ